MTDLLNNNRQCNFDIPTSIIQQLRLIKSDAEIKLMKESSRIASDSMKCVIQVKLCFSFTIFIYELRHVGY